MNAPETPPNLAQNLPAPDVALAYAVLHHTAVPQPHFDLLLQLPGRERLLTWHLAAPPDAWASVPPVAQRIQDHRPLYMTFEGELSNHRGTVQRVAAGAAHILSHTPTHLILQLLAPTPCTLTLPL